MSLLVLASLALVLGLVCRVVYSADVRKQLNKARSDAHALVSDVEISVGALEARVSSLEDAAKKAGLDLKKAL